MIIDKFIELTCGRFVDGKTIALTSTDGELEYGVKHAEINIWSSDEAKPVFESTTIKACVEQCIHYKSERDNFNGICVLSSAAADSVVFFIQNGKARKETIKKLLDKPIATCMHALTVIDGMLYTCGDDGTVFRREGKSKWLPVDAGVRPTMSSFDASMLMRKFVKEKKKAGQTEPHPLIEWMDTEQYKYTDGRNLYAINGRSQNDIYACGSIDTPKGKVGILYHYDGNKWSKLDIPETNTLCSIFVDDNRILVGGYDGHLLESQDGYNFKDVSTPDDLMIINEFAKYHDTLYLGTSDGLFQYKNGEVSTPNITADIALIDNEILTGSLNIDIHDDYLLLVGRFSSYHYCFTTRQCELLIRFTGRGEENDE
ncbi:hypothetical protein NK529_004137 [Citrobacter amalonaticus]|nr:hypothetical protein [Citrobacter amalonaticus]HAT3924539.1 hypothetical protein [Citrobacter amalonaticus]